MDVCNVREDIKTLTIGAIPIVEIIYKLILNNVMIPIMILRIDVINAYLIALFLAQIVLRVFAINVRKDILYIKIYVIRR